MAAAHLREHRPDIVAIGASAGGVEAISALLSELPRDLPATVFVVLHRPIGRLSHLPEILAARTHLRVVVPHGTEPLERGVCFIAPSDRHLTLGSDLRMHLLPDHLYRGRNIDALFSSLAHSAGDRTIGVVLSGTLRDGTVGLKEIKENGGVALVQSPAQASFSDMPRNAIKYNGPVDFVGPIHALAVEIGRRAGHLHDPDAASDPARGDTDHGASGP